MDICKPLAKLGHALLPLNCAFCGVTSVNKRLCSACQADLPGITAACLRCGVALARTTVTCGACQKKPPPVDATLCAFRYAFPIDALIKNLKFSGQRHYGPVLGGLLADALRKRAIDADAIIAVPLHYKREQTRGYNQAEEIARELARRSGIARLKRAAVRVRATTEQTTLDRGQRRKNLRGAFEIHTTARSVIVVDDVLTTGATVYELARALRRAGTETITIACVARVHTRLVK